MSEAAHESLAELMHTWVKVSEDSWNALTPEEVMGFPCLTVVDATEPGASEKSIKVSQKLFRNAYTLVADGTVWKVPVAVASRAGTQNLVLNSEESVFKLDGVKPNDWFVATIPAGFLRFQGSSSTATSQVSIEFCTRHLQCLTVLLALLPM